RLIRGASKRGSTGTRAVILSKLLICGQSNTENAGVARDGDRLPSAVAMGSRDAAWWKRVFPSFVWLRRYDRGWFRPDLVAGITLAAYLLPAALADALLAGLPVQAGLYSCLFGGLVFWLFCSSRQTAITVTSAISLLIGSSLGGSAGRG